MIKTNKPLISEDFINHRERVRTVFSSSDGRLELMNIIQDSKLFDTLSLDDKEGIANRNFAIKKLEEMGMLDRRVIKEFVDFYLTRDNKSIEMRIRNELLKEERKQKGEKPFDKYKEI